MAKLCHGFVTISFFYIKILILTRNDLAESSLNLKKAPQLLEGTEKVSI